MKNILNPFTRVPAFFVSLLFLSGSLLSAADAHAAMQPNII